MMTDDDEVIARSRAIKDGHDPDEVVSYGPPTSHGGSDPVEQEAPLWWSYSDKHRKRMGLSTISERETSNAG